MRELLKDAAGREHFRRFLEKEFSAENLKSVTQLTIYLFIYYLDHTHNTQEEKKHKSHTNVIHHAANTDHLIKHASVSSASFLDKL